MDPYCCHLGAFDPYGPQDIQVSTGGFCGHSLSTVRNYQGNQVGAQGRYRSVLSTSSALAHVRCDGGGYSAARDRGAETSEVAEKYPVRNRHRCPACVLRMEMGHSYAAAGVDHIINCFCRCRYAILSLVVR